MSNTELNNTELSDKVFRFHLLGLAHLPVSEEYMACAFTQKIVKLSKMLLSLGHEVYLYGAEGSDAPCTEFIKTHDLRDIRRYWGEGDNRFAVGYNWKDKGFKHDFNAPKTGATLKYISNAIHEINLRKRDDDFLLCTQGVYQKDIADGVNLWLTCEPGIGYRGTFAKYRAFESSYLQNFVYGSQHPFESINGNYYDRVIPNYFEAKHFPFVEHPEGDYFLFIGRLIHRKGIATAIATAEALKKKLIVAGQGDFFSDSPYVEFFGYADAEQRAKLMGNAIATFVPTQYMEAFGGVNVESQLCGTPVITTNFAVFPETVKHGVTGFTCNTLQDFVNAARAVGDLDRARVRLEAERYLTDNVKYEFQNWFQDLYRLWMSAFITGEKGWSYYE